jgi:hypothetical protein
MPTSAARVSTNSNPNQPPDMLSIYDLDLGEPVSAEDLADELRSNESTPLVRGLLQWMRREAIGGFGAAAALASEDKPGQQFQLGGAQAWSEAAESIWRMASTDPDP